nr:substrate-binding domain-containing protein [Pseudomonas kairouanensis]
MELSSELFRKLESDQLDLVIVPDVYSDPRFHSTPLQRVENAWMCSPGLIPDADPISLETLASYTVLTQGSQSGTGMIYERWLATHNIQLPRTLTSHNLLVQAGLALSGIGVSYLPVGCLSHLIEQGTLRALVTQPALPDIQYVALHRVDRQFGLNQDVARLAQACCDFSRLLF